MTYCKMVRFIGKKEKQKVTLNPSNALKFNEYKIIGTVFS